MSTSDDVSFNDLPKVVALPSTLTMARTVLLLLLLLPLLPLSTCGRRTPVVGFW